MAFTINGKNADVSKFNKWFHSVTAGLTFFEAVAVIATSPLIHKKAMEFPGVQVRFNKNVLKNLKPA